MSNKILVIVGAGGHGRAVAEIAAVERYHSVFFLDENYDPARVQFVDGHLLVGNTSCLEKFIEVKNCIFFVAIGHQATRKRITEKIISLKLPLANLIHSAAYISPSARLSVGIAVMAGAVVGAHAEVGTGVIINANATADHDTKLEDYVHLGVGVQLAGGVQVQESAWMQAGSCAGYHVTVPSHSVIPPGQALIQEK